MCLSLERDFLFQRTLICFDYDSFKDFFTFEVLVNVNVAILKFQLICNQTPRFTIGDCAAGHRADNRDKNRNVLIVPRKLNLFVTNSNFRVKSNL